MSNEVVVGIIMGSDSDLPVMKDAGEVLDYFGIKYEITIVSAHRTPERLFEYSKDAQKRGLKIIVAGAGGAAHLPGMIASITALPVIGVPIKTSSLSGLDSLLSIVQMPGGVPVATVAINGARNAGILAAQIIGINESKVQEKVLSYKRQMKESVIEKANKLERIGHESYLEEGASKNETGNAI